MYQYPEEWKKYKSGREYQALVVGILKEIFPPNIVCPEWDASMYSLHPRSRVSYAPRTDIAIGPFNSGADIDIGIDNTGVMRSHPLFKELTAKKEIGWNHFSRCFLAIEIIFSGAPKYILGDLANASFTGSIGFVIAGNKKLHGKASRMSYYYQSQSDADDAPMRNLMIFTDEDFLQFLWELKNPDQVWRLSVNKKYSISFEGLWGGTRFPVVPYTSGLGVEDELSARYQKKFAMYGFDVKRIVDAQEVLLSARKYIIPTTSAFIYKFVMNDGDEMKAMEILDMAAQKQYRGKGIESQLISIFEELAKKNDCKYIVTQLAEARGSDPLEEQKELFRKHGFEVWYDKQSEFSGWSTKKVL